MCDSISWTNNGWDRNAYILHHLNVLLLTDYMWVQLFDKEKKRHRGLEEEVEASTWMNMGLCVYMRIKEKKKNFVSFFHDDQEKKKSVTINILLKTYYKQLHSVLHALHAIAISRAWVSLRTIDYFCIFDFILIIA